MIGRHNLDQASLLCIISRGPWSAAVALLTGIDWTVSPALDQTKGLGPRARMA